VAFLLILAAGAWAATVALARGMAGMAGTMGLGLAAFVPIWTLMMAAMMLPSVSPVASLYARTIQGSRAIGSPGSSRAILRSGRRRACPPTGWPGSPAG
jgi:predicted metal-binding membrane protein